MPMSYGRKRWTELVRGICRWKRRKRDRVSGGQREEERLCRAERVVFPGAFGAARSASWAAIQILHKREPKAKQAPQNAQEERATMELGSKEKKRGGRALAEIETGW